MNELKKNGVPPSGRPVVFGEVLFDDFEDGPTVIGGAAFNLAWNLESIGLGPLAIGVLPLLTFAWAPVPTLLLHHVGRKSGTAFTTPLLYLRDGDGPDADLVIVASQGGLPKNPQWFHNLMATPDCEVSLPGRRRVPVHAHRADPAEKERLWPLLVDLYADFAKYAVWTDRDIPVVVLSPR